MIQRTRRTLTLAAAGVLLGGASAGAQAFIIEQTGTGGSPEQMTWKVTATAADIGGTFTIDWLIPEGTFVPDQDCDLGVCTIVDGKQYTPADLKAWATFELSGFTETALDLDIVIKNDTDLGWNENIHAFGFNMEPNATGVTLTQDGQVFNHVGLDQTFPAFQTVNICVWAAQNCSGGTQPQGLAPQQTDSLSLSMTGNFEGTFVMLLDFPLKWQGDFGSFEVPGTPRNGDTPNGPSEVPEPASLALLALGLLATGWGARRRRGGDVPA